MTLLFFLQVLFVPFEGAIEIEGEFDLLGNDEGERDIDGVDDFADFPFDGDNEVDGVKDGDSSLSSRSSPIIVLVLGFREGASVGGLERGGLVISLEGVNDF